MLCIPLHIRCVQPDYLQAKHLHGPNERFSLGTWPGAAAPGPKKPARRFFPCPVREKDLQEGLLPHCAGCSARTMGDFRRHLLSWHFFIRQCTVCKNNILDAQLYDAFHGKDKCTAMAGVQPRLGALDSAYDALCEKVQHMTFIMRNSRKYSSSTERYN
jgi:hypothetical protein